MEQKLRMLIKPSISKADKFISTPYHLTIKEFNILQKFIPKSLKFRGADFLLGPAPKSIK